MRRYQADPRHPGALRPGELHTTADATTRVVIRFPARSPGSFFARFPRRSSLPRMGVQVGLHIVLFEDCSAFTHVTACTLAKSPYVTLYTRGFSHFVTSMTAPIASGWSESCRVGLAPTEKTPPCHGTHPQRTVKRDVRRSGMSQCKKRQTSQKRGCLAAQTALSLKKAAYFLSL